MYILWPEFSLCTRSRGIYHVTNTAAAIPSGKGRNRRQARKSLKWVVLCVLSIATVKNSCFIHVYTVYCIMLTLLAQKTYTDLGSATGMAIMSISISVTSDFHSGIGEKF